MIWAKKKTPSSRQSISESSGDAEGVYIWEYFKMGEFT